MYSDLMHMSLHVPCMSNLSWLNYTGWLSEVYIPGSGIKVPGSVQAPGVYSLLAASLVLNLCLVKTSTSCMHMLVYLHLN